MNHDAALTCIPRRGLATADIAGVDVGPGHPCRVVAELSNAHNGKLENALRIVEEAKSAGADFLKLQTYTPRELIELRGDGRAPDPWGACGWTMRDLYTKAATPHEWLPAIVAKCDEVGIPWFSSVFGIESMLLLDQWRCPAYKVAALDITRPLLVGDVTAPHRRAGRVIIASSPVGRVPWADLTLYCPPGYPQALSAIGPRPWADGFSYHGTEPAELLWAVDGACHMLEVHVQLDDVPSELESNVSLTMSQLRKLCEAVK